MLFGARRFLAALAPQALACLLVACGGDDASDSTPPPDTTAPTIPTGLTVVPQSPSQMLVSWTASTDAGAGVAGYRVYRDGGATAIANVTTGTVYSDSNLNPATNYRYAVRAYDAAVPPNESALTDSVGSITPPMPATDTTPPTVPVNLLATATAPDTVHLSWTASTDVGTGVAGYRIFRDGAATAVATVMRGTSFDDTGLAANTAYSYTILAFDFAVPENVSAMTGAVNVTTPANPDTTAPTVPGGLTAVAQSSTSVQLQWTASTDAGTGVAGYRIFRNGTGSAPALTTVSAATLTFTDTGLAANTAYTYSVRAIDAAMPANVSAASAPATATTPAATDTTAPSVPGSVTAIAQTGTSIQITWAASTDNVAVAGYRIFRNGSATVLATVTSGTTYTDSGLTASTQYSYQLRAFDTANPANDSALSTPAAMATTLADTQAPSVPTSVTATAVSTTQIRISWAASTDSGGAGIAGYRIFRDGGATVLATVTSGTTYIDGGLASNTSYSYTVRAFDAATPPNVSGLSGAASATTLVVADTTPPTTPTGLIATALSSTSIRLNWNASTDAGVGLGGYYVYDNGSGGGSPIATVTSGTTYTVTNLAPSTTYTFTVRAFDDAGTPNVSAASVAASGTTQDAPDITPPSVPTGVTATALSASDIRIDWNASTDAGSGVAGYRIFRNGSGTVLATVTSGTTYTDSGLTPSTSYSYTVRAFDAVTPPNVSGLSSAASATTQALPDITAPTVPTGVSAIAVSTTEIRIDWSASTDAGSGVAGYRIFRDGSGTVLATVTLGTTYTDSGLSPNTSYSYAIRAFDAVTPPNVSGLSASASATTLVVADTTPPTTPTSLAATVLSSTSIRLNWNASTDAGVGLGGYYVYNNGSGGGSPIATVTSGTTYTLTNLTPSTAYTFSVRAFDMANPPNVSAASNSASGTTQGAPDTTAPTIPTAVIATALSDSEIRIDWNASSDTGSGVAGYRIFRNGSGTILATVTSGTTYTDSGLTANTNYSYTVRAFDAVTPPNVSGLSSAANATTQALPDTAPPTVPTGVSATALSSTQIRIDWSASTDTGSGVAGYRIFRNGSGTVLATVTSGTTYTDSGLTASTNYSYTLRAFDAVNPPNVSGLSSAANATTLSSQNPVSGLDTRPSNTTCVAGAPPSQSTNFTQEPVFDNLNFAAGVQILQAPADSTRWFVVQQSGLVQVIPNVANPMATTFIDLTQVVRFDGEMGLLGMAFHPNFPTDPRVYLSFVAGSASARSSYIAEYRTTNGGATLDASTRFNLLTIVQPEENHNGGNVMFGPDGYLYAGFGDGGGGGDQHGTYGNSQLLTTLLGKIIRLNVGATPGQAYTIPANNPYAQNARCNTGTGAANCPEIYAYGFRNPWRWSFDSGTGDLWVGDVGESSWEEIDRVILGGNYGWRCREGNHNYQPGNCGPNSASALNPIAEVDRSAAVSITGGYVYRGTAMPGLVGRYVFGDFSSGFIWHIARDTVPTLGLDSSGTFSTGANISSFAEGVDRELYYLDYNGGLHKLVPAGGSGGGTIASLLSQTGCANSSNPAQPASGMIPYAPNAPFWSDGAVKTRWLALPNGQHITIDGVSNDFDLPNGSVLRKDFTLNGVLAETRLFMHHTDGNWAGYTYQWNAMGTEATRVVGGATATIGGQTWDFPSEAQCLQCHTVAAGRTLGLETGQLNGDLLYPATGRIANQMFTLNFIDMLRPVITLPLDQLPAIPNPFGTAGTTEQRARAWLHSNCANCHRPGGPTPTNLDLRYTTSLLGTNTCEVAPSSGDLGIANARLIAVGDASRSVVVARVDRVGTSVGAMPPLSRHSIDTQGVTLLTQWINGLTSCN